MTKTMPAEYIGKPDLGYVLLAFISESGRQQIERVLESLQQELPDVLWTPPPETLHITLCEIIQPMVYAQDKETLYKLHQREYEDLPAEILASFRKIKVTFDAIEASPQAIIIRGHDNGSFDAIRSQLADRLPLPAETRTPPDIIHSSIARYTAEVDYEMVRDIVAKHALTFDEEITEFNLLKTIVPPVLEYETVRTYPLL